MKKSFFIVIASVFIAALICGNVLIVQAASKSTFPSEAYVESAESNPSISVPAMVESLGGVPSGPTVGSAIIVESAESEPFAASQAASVVIPNTNTSQPFVSQIIVESAEALPFVSGGGELVGSGTGDPLQSEITVESVESAIASFVSFLLAQATLAQPSNLRHTANTPSSIVWVWDAVPNATSYLVYLWDGAAFNPANPPSSVSNTYTLSTLFDGVTPLSADTVYIIEIQARDARGTFADSVFSDSASAATSANAPTALSGAPVGGTDGTEIDWSWSTGGAQTEFYAQLLEDPLKTSGLTTGTTWRATGLTCNTAYTLQVLATNQNRNACFTANSCTPGGVCPNCTGDETAWQTTQTTTDACPLTCVNVASCDPIQTTGDICLEETIGNPATRFCNLGTACTPNTTWCNAWFNNAPTDGVCVANTCDTKPTAAITISKNGTADNPSVFNGSTSSDYPTAVGSLKARWDFDYQAGQPGEPNWSDLSNVDYPSGKNATDTVNHQYAAGSYTVALQVRDSAGQDSNIVTMSIVIGGGTIAINPDRAPTTNIVDNSYNFGVIPPNKIVDIIVTICNLGDADLVISDYQAQNELPSDMDPDAFQFKDATGASAFLKPLTLIDDPALASIPLGSRICNPNVNPLSRQDARIRFFVPSGTSEGNYHQELVIQSNDTATPSKELFFDVVVKSSPVGTKGTESIKFDGRAIANPPPLFVEFLDQLQFKEEQKTR